MRTLWPGRELWDARTHRYQLTCVLVFPVRHVAYVDPLWLVVARESLGREPWYLLTNEPVETEEEAWRIVLVYTRRWQIE